MHCSQVSWALRLGLRSARWGIKRHPAPLSAAYPKIKTVPSRRVRVNLMFMVSILIIQGTVVVLTDTIHDLEPVHNRPQAIARSIGLRAADHGFRRTQAGAARKQFAVKDDAKYGFIRTGMLVARITAAV